jgi:hypothetical protein
MARAIIPDMLGHKDTEERAKLREERLRNRPKPPPVHNPQPFTDFKVCIIILIELFNQLIISFL